jgi:hypothetical protein
LCINWFRPALAFKQTTGIVQQLLFHWLTCVGWTPNSWAISLIVFALLIASSATLAFCAPVNIFRLLSLISCPSFPTGYSLNYCLDFGVHFIEYISQYKSMY